MLRDAARGLSKHAQLERRQRSIHIPLGQAPRNLGVTAHRARTGTGGIDEHGIEHDALPRPCVKRRQRGIQIAGIARYRANTRYAGAQKPMQILIAFALVKVESKMGALEAGTHGLTRHDERLRPAAGTDLEARAGTSGRRGDQLRVQIARHSCSALENTGGNHRVGIDGSIATGENRGDETV